MKRMKSWTRFVVVCLGVMVLLSGCGLKPKDDGTYYKKEDFQSITVGESTLEYVYKKQILYTYSHITLHMLKHDALAFRGRSPETNYEL